MLFASEAQFGLSARVRDAIQTEFAAMFEGIFTALITPFKDGRIDGAALDALIGELRSMLREPLSLTGATQA